MQIDRQRVGRSFSRGAEEYDLHTPVQKRVMETLLGFLSGNLNHFPSRILDVGCGTGQLLMSLSKIYPEASLFGLDLSSGMLEKAAEILGGNAVLVNGDAESPPFQSSFFDLVVSTSTFQWLENLFPCFSAVHAILKPGSRFVFAMFGDGTLKELQDSWREALLRTGRDYRIGDDGTHVFHCAESVINQLSFAGFRELSVESTAEVVWYPDVPRLLHAIKRVGAGSSRPPSGGGLGWRRVIHEMAAVYSERYGGSEGLPVTYQVIYGTGIS